MSKSADVLNLAKSYISTQQEVMKAALFITAQQRNPFMQSSKQFGLLRPSERVV